MPIRPPVLGSRKAECLAELNACIFEAETSTSAQAVTTRILTAIGFDTSEVLHRLWADKVWLIETIVPGMPSVTRIYAIQDWCSGGCTHRRETPPSER